MLDTSRIDTILNTFLADNGFECEVFMDTDFGYYYSTSKIGYSLVVSERMDRLFFDFARRCGLQTDCGIFLLSFFHELGHNETIDELEDEEVFYSADVKETLTDKDEDCEIYFNLPDEILATEWAIDYIDGNKETVGELARLLQREIKIFCEENEIEG